MELSGSLHKHVFADDAADKLADYLNDEDYSGAWFERIGGPGDAEDVADRFTGDDVAAVATLSVNIPGWAVVELLHRRADELSGLLAAVPNGRALVDASDDDIGKLFALQNALDTVRGVGHVTRSKLLARKRPHLVPIRDQHVLVALLGRAHGPLTVPLRDALRADTAVRGRLEELREGSCRPELSILRVLDIVVWMRVYGATSIV